MLTFSLFAGELPKELGDLVNLTFFDASDNKFQGKSYAPAYTRRMFAEISLVFAGELPKELGQLSRLTRFDVSDNAQYEKDEDGDDDYDRPIPGTGFTGKLHLQHTCVNFADISIFSQGSCPRSSAN